MSRLTFSLSLSSEQFLRHYQGSAAWIRVTADNGQTLKLPAANFRQFLGHNGIHGRFLIEFDDNFKLKSLIRL